MHRKLTILFGFLLLTGCSGLPTLHIDPMIQDIAAYELGYRFAQQNPELVPAAEEVCAAVLKSSDEDFIQEIVLASVLSLAANLESEHDKQLIQRLVKGLKITQAEKGQPLGFGEVEVRDIKIVVQAFSEGMGAI